MWQPGETDEFPRLRPHARDSPARARQVAGLRHHQHAPDQAGAEEALRPAGSAAGGERHRRDLQDGTEGHGGQAGEQRGSGSARPGGDGRGGGATGGGRPAASRTGAHGHNKENAKSLNGSDPGRGTRHPHEVAEGQSAASRGRQGAGGARGGNGARADDAGARLRRGGAPGGRGAAQPSPRRGSGSSSRRSRRARATL